MLPADFDKYVSNYHEQMSTSERISAYKRGETVDHQPFSLHGGDLAVASAFGYSTSKYFNSEEARVFVINYMRNTFGIDSLNVGLSLRAIGASLGTTLYYPEDGLDRVEEYILKDWGDFEALEVIDPYSNQVLTPLLESAKELKNKFANFTLSTNVVGPITNAIAVMPIETFLKETRRNPEMCEKLLDLMVVCSLKWVEAFKKEFGVVDVVLNDPVSCSDILSNKQFERISFPYLQKLIDGIELTMGEKPGSHICGHTKSIWESLDKLGVNFFSLDNCEDLFEAKLAIGNKMMLSGNVPPVEVMLNGSVEDVINSCVECLIKASDSKKGFILNTGCQTPLGTPKENIEAFIYAVRKYGAGACLGKYPEGLKKYLCRIIFVRFEQVLTSATKRINGVMYYYFYLLRGEQ